MLDYALIHPFISHIENDMTKEKTINIPTYMPRLILTLDMCRPLEDSLLSDILDAADFASVILYDSANDESLLQKRAEQLVPTIQNKNIAALIANDTRISARIKADGVHLEGSIDDLKNMLERHQDTMIIGFGNLRDRHKSMEAGEAEPAYLMFGKLGADKKPEPHPRNLALATWWADVMEIPAIIQAGNDLSLFSQTLETGADFIALEEMLFTQKNPLAVLKEINQNLQTFVPSEEKDA